MGFHRAASRIFGLSSRLPTYALASRLMGVLRVWEIWLTLSEPQESVVAKVGHSMTHVDNGQAAVI
jgi:hypothetical protein